MLSDPQVWLSLLTLTVLEVVLSIDNLVVIAVLVGKLPKARQAQARYIGMTLALSRGWCCCSSSAGSSA